MTATVWFKRLRPTAQLPTYQTSHAAGADLSADLEHAVELKPMQRIAVPTGLAMQLPQGFEAQVRPRSGLALKNGVTVLNTPGTIDADYRGEVKVILLNLGEDTFVIEPGMRIAQMVIAPVSHAHFIEVAELEQTERGTGGFGSTGLAQQQGEKK